MTAALERNISAFIGFRVLFNARFYYPVFAILFLDYGLTLEQFTILNIVWAITIVVAEVPSGALADIIGRRNLVVFAAAMMVIEMGLLVFVPIGQSWFLVTVFAINRICSGLAEAAASGADEALAYDSLVKLGREEEWSAILEKTSRRLSMAFFATMIIGAVSYDADMLNRVFSWVGCDLGISKDFSIRLPILFTFCTSLIVLAFTLRMTEVEQEDERQADSTSEAFRNDSRRSATGKSGSSPLRFSIFGFRFELPLRLSSSPPLLHTIKESFLQIARVATWTLNHRFILFVILGGIIIDSVARQLIIFASEYYRTIGFEPAYFGFISAALALLGILYAKLARLMAEKLRPLTNFYLLSAVLIVGLIGCSFTFKYYGVIFSAMVFCMLGIIAYLQSYYINKHAESKIRATVLSFKGLALNLALGIASLFYAILIAGIRDAKEGEGLAEGKLEDFIFVDSLPWFPGYYAVLFVVVILAGARFIRSKELL